MSAKSTFPWKYPQEGEKFLLPETLPIQPSVLFSAAAGTVFLHAGTAPRRMKPTLSFQLVRKRTLAGPGLKRIFLPRRNRWFLYTIQPRGYAFTLGRNMSLPPRNERRVGPERFS